MLGATKRLVARIVVLAIALALLAMWAAYAVENSDTGSGCTYSSGECGDPAPGNFPAAPGN
jgi:hypothetical protein